MGFVLTKLEMMSRMSHPRQMGRRGWDMTPAPVCAHKLCPHIHLLWPSHQLHVQVCPADCEQILVSHLTGCIFMPK